jgi:hypothetical protein
LQQTFNSLGELGIGKWPELVEERRDDRREEEEDKKIKSDPNHPDV